jgi:hypothetical protein
MRAFLKVLAVSAGLAHAGAIHAAQREEWSGTYHCGPRLKDLQPGSAYAAQAKLVLNDGVATITRQSARVRETMTGKVGADGRITLEGGGVMIDDGGRWRYRFEGRFEGNKFEARGAMLSPTGESKIRECTMTLARTSPAVSKAPAADKEPAASPPPVVVSTPPPVPSAVSKAPEPPAPATHNSEPPPAKAAAPAPDTATRAAAQRSAPAEPRSPADVTPAPVATEDKKEDRTVIFSRAENLLLALFAGIAAGGIGVLLYDWRRPRWLTPKNALAAFLATVLGTAAVAGCVLLYLNL